MSALSAALIHLCPSSRVNVGCKVEGPWRAFMLTKTALYLYEGVAGKNDIEQNILLVWNYFS